jgi:hypothetical protein
MAPPSAKPGEWLVLRKRFRMVRPLIFKGSNNGSYCAMSPVLECRGDLASVAARGPVFIVPEPAASGADKLGMTVISTPEPRGFPYVVLRISGSASGPYCLEKLAE